MGLKQKRKDRHLTQAQVAEIFGLKRQTYQNYENGKTEPSLEIAGKMARFFDCSIGDLFDLQETAIPLSKEEKRLIALFADLNDDGKATLIGYAEGLLQSDQYRKKEMSDHPVSDVAIA